MSHSSKSADGTAEVCPTRMRSDEITAHNRRKISKHCYLCRKADINNKLVGDTPSPVNDRTAVKKYRLIADKIIEILIKETSTMENEKRKRGRPPKIFTAETTGMTYEGTINYALDRQLKSELDKALADKPDNELTDEERKYLDGQRSNRTRTLNIRFTEREYRDIEDKCEQYGYKKKSEYVRDCVKARVPTINQPVDLSETNRELKAIGRNINQIAVRLHSTGNIYAEDMTEIKRGVNQIWQLLLSIRSRAISAAQSPTSLTEIRPSTEYMSHLICAGTTAEGQQRISTPSES